MPPTMPFLAFLRDLEDRRLTRGAPPAPPPVPPSPPAGSAPMPSLLGVPLPTLGPLYPNTLPGDMGPQLYPEDVLSILAQLGQGPSPGGAAAAAPGSAPLPSPSPGPSPEPPYRFPRARVPLGMVPPPPPAPPPLPPPPIPALPLPLSTSIGVPLPAQSTKLPGGFGVAMPPATTAYDVLTILDQFGRAPRAAPPPPALPPSTRFLQQLAMSGRHVDDAVPRVTAGPPPPGWSDWVDPRYWAVTQAVAPPAGWKPPRELDAMNFLPFTWWLSDPANRPLIVSIWQYGYISDGELLRGSDAVYAYFRNNAEGFYSRLVRILAGIVPYARVVRPFLPL